MIQPYGLANICWYHHRKSYRFHVWYRSGDHIRQRLGGTRAAVDGTSHPRPYGWYGGFRHPACGTTSGRSDHVPRNRYGKTKRKHPEPVGEQASLGNFAIRDSGRDRSLPSHAACVKNPRGGEASCWQSKGGKTMTLRLLLLMVAVVVVSNAQSQLLSPA